MVEPRLKSRDPTVKKLEREDITERRKKNGDKV